MRAPSMTAYGSIRRMLRSLNVPGSPSAPLTTTVVGSAGGLFSLPVRPLPPRRRPGGRVVLQDRAPLPARREAGATAAAQAGGIQLVDDRHPLDGLGIL